jgi:splicing factor 3B subunit 4
MAVHLDRNQEATVWIGGLDEQVDEGLLWELMLQAGPVVSVNMPRDKITNEHSGYAFCEFSSEEDADYAMKIMNMVKLFGKSLKINKASRDKKDTGVGANIFVGNLDNDVDDQLLYTTFSAFGQVLSAKVMYEEDGTSKLFGFVNFADFESSDAAITHMNGQYLCNRAVHVSYAYKKDSHKEKHGSENERYLAKLQSKSIQRPHMHFAATGGASSSIPTNIPTPTMQPSNNNTMDINSISNAIAANLAASQQLLGTNALTSPNLAFNINPHHHQHHPSLFNPYMAAAMNPMMNPNFNMFAAMQQQQQQFQPPPPPPTATMMTNDIQQQMNAPPPPPPMQSQFMINPNQQQQAWMNLALQQQQQQQQQQQNQ